MRPNRLSPSLLVSTHADHNPRHYAFSRTQAEAGLAHYQWEGRLKPLKSWAYYFAATMAWTIFAVSVMWALLG